MKKINLNEVNDRDKLLSFANQRGYDTSQNRLPLDFYKKEINLVSFAEFLGYKIKDNSKLSNAAFRNSKWIYMEKDQAKFPQYERSENANSKILIARRSVGPNNKNFKYNEHYYFSQDLTHTGDRRNHGSIIDLVQLHFAGDLKRSLRLIENFITKHKSNKIDLVNHLKGTHVNEASKIKTIKDFPNAKPFTDFSFLNSRGISNDTINHPAFHKPKAERIYNYISDDGKHTNTAFPINSTGLIGLEVRNADFKGIIGQKQDGFSRSNIDESRQVDAIFVTESFIDSLSKFELDKNMDNNVLHLSTAGNVSPRQIELLGKMMEHGVVPRSLLLRDVKPHQKKDVVDVYGQRNYKGDLVLNESTGDPVQVATLLTNKPKILQLGYDNDSSGSLIAIKTLAHLSPSNFDVSNDNKAFSQVNIYPSLNRKENKGKVIWDFSNVDKDVDKYTKDAISQLVKSVDKLNDKHADVLTEGPPFKLHKENDFVEISFKDIPASWELMVDTIKDLKFANTPKIERVKPLTKDWNMDLKGKKEIDPLSTRIYNIAVAENNLNSNVSKKQENNEDLMDHINRAMDSKSNRVKI